MTYNHVMMLDTDICYRALESRDRRFDGKFFTGVISTGIYCRPICPAPTPKKSNCRFFPCAAAAQEAGLRPCLRCRPDTSPGTPAWAGTSATVSRAMRLIEQGALDTGGVEELAGRLGMGARHLRRLFREHLGTHPLAVARTKRLHFARKLIDETSLPMIEVAHAAGFRSVRRFNAAVQAGYGGTPTALRKRTLSGRPEVRDASLYLRLGYREPFDWDALLAFLTPRVIPGVEAVEPGVYRRALRFEGSEGILQVTRSSGRSGGFLTLQVPAALAAHLPEIVARVRRLFDLDADPLEIEKHLGRAPDVGRLVRANPGLRVPGAWDPFETAIRAIVGQQVTVRGATTLTGRLVRAWGRKLEDPGSGGLGRLFPDPEDLVHADLTSIGLTAARADAVRGLAAALCAGTLVLDGAPGLERVVAQLKAIPGVGDWTAQYIALRALGEPDAFPAGDLGLRRALARNGRTPSSSALSERAAAWRPWRAYAAVHLWSRAHSGD